MKTFIFLILVLHIASNVFGQQCGVNNAGVITQQLTDESFTATDGLFYDHEANKLYFVDRYKPALCCIDGKSAIFNRTEIPDVKYIAGAIPIKNVKDKMIGLADNKMVYLILQRDSDNNIIKITTEDIEEIETNSDYSFTYSKIDQKGRLWTDMATQFQSPDVTGKLFQIIKNKSIKEMIKNAKLPSGIGFSPDNTLLYHVDSVLNTVTKYDFNINAGTISKPEIIYNLTQEEYIDGSISSLTVAKDNTLWLGICEIGALVNYNWKKKQYNQVHQLPALHPISLEFGGPDLDVLFVGTENKFPEDTPAGGAVFAISGTGSKGIESFKVSKLTH